MRCLRYSPLLLVFALVQTLVSTARSVGTRTIAKSVETRADWELAAVLEVDYGQGYLFGRPETAPVMPVFDPADVKGRLEEERSRASGELAAFYIFPPGAKSAIAGLFSDEVIDAVEARHYPQLPAGRPVPVLQAAFDGLKLAGIAIIANLLALPFLLVFLIYVLITWGVNGWLLGREYFEMVAFRRMDRANARELHRRHNRTFTIAGVMIAVCLTIPFVNLLAPVLGAAFMVHVAQNVLNHTRTATQAVKPLA